MGRRHAYALAAGAALSLFLSRPSIAQPPQQPGGPAVPVQPGGGPGMPGGAGMPTMPGGGAPGVPGNPGGGPGMPGQPGGPGAISRPGGAGIEQVRPSQGAPAPQRWRDMSPQERQQLRMNAERWQQMDAEERKAFREQQAWRKMRLKREAEEAMRESGLQLEAERRAIFERRYIEERRRIDEELRRELREKRQRELAPVVEKLKKEFTEQRNGGSGNSPSGSPKK